MTDVFDAVRRLQKDCWTTAEVHGFHEPMVRPGETEPRKLSITERLALIHSEISEALEEVRAGRLEMWRTEDGKPEGVVVELADAVVRIFDLCTEHGMDLATALDLKMRFNTGREFMHGKAL